MAECPTPFKQKHSKAEAIAHLISLRRKDGAFTVQAYRCVEGSHWHVGHRPTPNRRRRHR
jgi:hypothetical protein